MRRRNNSDDMAGTTTQLDPRWEVDINCYAGKQLTFTLQLQDGDEVDIDLTGWTAEAKIVDENNTTILDLSPSIVAASGQFVVDVEVPSATSTGRYDWRGTLIEATGEAHPRFFGKVNIYEY